MKYFDIEARVLKFIDFIAVRTCWKCPLGAAK